MFKIKPPKFPSVVEKPKPSAIRLSSMILLLVAVVMEVVPVVENPSSTLLHRHPRFADFIRILGAVGIHDTCVHYIGLRASLNHFGCASSLGYIIIELLG